MVWAIRQIQSSDLLQKQLNAILAQAEALKPGYAAALPDALTQPDGRYFTLTTTQALYQMQGGSWVLVAT